MGVFGEKFSSVHYGRWVCSKYARIYRSTNDIDLWLKDEIPNRRNFGKAMGQFGYEEINWDEIQFVPGWSEFYIGPGIRLDIMTTMKGLDHISFD